MKNSKDLKVAIVGEGFFFYEGANRVNKVFCEMFPNADIYGLFGKKKMMEEYFKGHKYKFSPLQHLPFISHIYKYSYFRWPIAIERFNLSEYDLVISSSYSCALGCIVPYPVKHISYVHTPMRYAWDQKDRYFNKRNFTLWKRLVIPFFLNYLRTWDVCAAQRPDFLISNSNFVSKRMMKYWKRGSDMIINPPVDLYKGKILEKRGKYFVTGSHLEPNKNGDILLNFVNELNLPIKIIGRCSRKIRRKYRKFSNIEFLGRISDGEKYKILSKARGYVTLGIEDFGIFPIEAMSCGTPVLFYKNGGVCESVIDGKTGIGIEKLSLDSFKKGIEKFNMKKWNYTSIAKYSKKFEKERFKRKLKKVVEEKFGFYFISDSSLSKVCDIPSRI